jgi:Peptidase family M48
MSRALIMHQSSHPNLSTLLCLPAILIGLAAPMDASEPRSAVALQELVNGLKTQLGIDAVVSAAIVTTNTLLVSVQPVDGQPGTFRMTFDERFLTTLDEDELKAIVAHELGHVWIFTHHPYLQTERLANAVAMRAVPRASLERVYGKVWERGGTKGDLARFLGPE